MSQDIISNTKLLPDKAPDKAPDKCGYIPFVRQDAAEGGRLGVPIELRY